MGKIRYEAIYIIHKTSPDKVKTFTNIQNAEQTLAAWNKRAGYEAYELVAIQSKDQAA